MPRLPSACANGYVICVCNRSFVSGMPDNVVDDLQPVCDHQTDLLKPVMCGEWSP